MISRRYLSAHTASASRAFWAVASLAALLFGAAALIRGAEFLTEALVNPAPLDGQEGMALWEADLLRSGQGLYVPVTPDRFVSAPYPPVHPALLVIFGDLPGPTVFTSGRLVSLVAALGAALCGFGLVRRVTGSAIGGLAASVLMLAFAPLQIWALRIKPDVTGLCLTFAGLWLASVSTSTAQHDAVSDPHRRRIWGVPILLVGAACLFVLAHFTKQTMLAAPLAVATLLLLVDLRLALRWSLLYLLLLALVWAALDLITYGQYTYHVWTLHRLPWTAARMAKFVVQLRDTWPLIGLGLAGLVATWRRPTVINAYLLWAPASLIGAGVVGSHHNHMLETGMALALAGGQALGLGLQYGGVLRLLAPVLVALQLFLWREPAPWIEEDYEPEPNFERYIEFVRQTPGEVLSDETGVLYAAGRPIPFDDPAAMGPASAIGLWDASRLIADIRAQRFRAILLRINVFNDLTDNTGRWTPEMLHAVRDAYELKFDDSMDIYVPKPRNSTP